jgi:hypothetical protein
MLKRLLIGAVLVVIPALASAQTVTGITLQAYAGTTAVGTPTVTLLTAWTCNLVAPTVPTGTITNPRDIWIPDPINNPTGVLTGVWCHLVDNGVSGPVSKLPFGATAYTMMAQFVNVVGNSPNSPSSNAFTEPGAISSAPTVLYLLP